MRILFSTFLLIYFIYFRAGFPDDLQKNSPSSAISVFALPAATEVVVYNHKT